MNYLKPNPKSWPIYTVNGDIVTGVSAGRKPHGYRYTYGERVKREIEEIDNFFFAASMKVLGIDKGQSSVITEFGDVDSDDMYYATSIATAAILLGVELGAIEIVDQAYSGIWTYRKMGTTVSLWPCYLDFERGETEIGKNLLDDARREWIDIRKPVANKE